MCAGTRWPPARQPGACGRIPVYVRRVCVDFLDAAWVCVGLLCLLRGCIALEFGLVSLGLHCVLRLSSAGLIVVSIPGYCWAYSALSVQHMTKHRSETCYVYMHAQNDSTPDEQRGGTSLYISAHLDVIIWM